MTDFGAERKLRMRTLWIVLSLAAAACTGCATSAQRVVQRPGELRLPGVVSLQDLKKPYCTRARPDGPIQGPDAVRYPYPHNLWPHSWAGPGCVGWRGFGGVSCLDVRISRRHMAKALRRARKR